jgi:hypothetical protein
MTENDGGSGINPDDRRAWKPSMPGVPDPSNTVALLDSIPGAFERAHQGLEEIRSGKGTALEDL